MKRIVILSFVLFSYGLPLFSQTDSLMINGEFRLLGRWQTGNLNQLVVSPSGNLTLEKEAFSNELTINYQFLQVEGFTVINDFWAAETFKLLPRKRIHPLLAVNYGFAQSYKIEQSLLIGGGIGINIIAKSPTNYLKIHAFLGYMNLDFQFEYPLSTYAAGTQIKALFPIGKKVFTSWNLATYHPGLEVTNWGFNNQLFVGFHINPNFSFTLSHAIIFNNLTVQDIKKVNTLMMAGLQYNLPQN